MSVLLLESQPWLAAAYGAMLYASLLLVAFVLTRLPMVARNITPEQGRFGGLDGFRGVLAIGVFVHHSFVAHGYFTRGVWEWTASPVLNHFGQTTVALFFMITGFLFTFKAQSAKLDWKAFYLSRLARLFPLYAAVVGVLFVLAILISGGLRESIWTLSKELVQWLAFACLGLPNIDGVPMTWTMIAGVNWSLKYEVLFYLFGVPMLFVLSRLLSPRGLLMLVGASLIVLLSYQVVVHQDGGNPLYLTHFLCGIFAACVYQQPRLLGYAQSRIFRTGAGAAVLVLAFFENAHGCIAILITLALFLAVVGGLSVFGLLHTRAALWLGDISYGVYLMHGMVLWLTLSALKAGGLLGSIELPAYDLLMVVVGSVVVVLASLSYAKLEKPAMAMAKQWSRAHPSVRPAKPA